MVFRNNHSVWHVVKHSSSLISIEEKKAEVDPRTLPQLRLSCMWQSYLICFGKRTKIIQQTQLSLKKIKKDLVSRSKLIVQNHCRNSEYYFFFPVTLRESYPASLFYAVVVNTDEVKVKFFFQQFSSQKVKNSHRNSYFPIIVSLTLWF